MVRREVIRLEDIKRDTGNAEELGFSFFTDDVTEDLKYK